MCIIGLQIIGFQHFKILQPTIRIAKQILSDSNKKVPEVRITKESWWMLVARRSKYFNLFYWGMPLFDLFQEKWSKNRSHHLTSFGWLLGLGVIHTVAPRGLSSQALKTIPGFASRKDILRCSTTCCPCRVDIHRGLNSKVKTPSLTFRAKSESDRKDADTLQQRFCFDRFCTCIFLNVCLKIIEIDWSSGLQSGLLGMTCWTTTNGFLYCIRHRCWIQDLSWPSESSRNWFQISLFFSKRLRLRSPADFLHLGPLQCLQGRRLPPWWCQCRSLGSPDLNSPIAHYLKFAWVLPKPNGHYHFVDFLSAFWNHIKFIDKKWDNMKYELSNVQSNTKLSQKGWPMWAHVMVIAIRTPCFMPDVLPSLMIYHLFLTFSCTCWAKFSQIWVTCLITFWRFGPFGLKKHRIKMELVWGGKRA